MYSSHAPPGRQAWLAKRLSVASSHAAMQNDERRGAQWPNSGTVPAHWCFARPLDNWPNESDQHKQKSHCTAIPSPTSPPLNTDRQGLCIMCT